MASDVRICVVIPTLNEEIGIGDVIRNLPKDIDGSRVLPLVVDGDSEDKTAEIAKKTGADIVECKFRGKGRQIREVLKSIDADIIVFIDGDGTYSSDELPLLVRPIIEGRADMVMGSRLENMEKGAMTPFNTIGNKIFNFFLRTFYGKDIKDMLTGYRAISSDCMDKLVIITNEFEIETEMTIEAIINNLRILEVPITYKRRKGKTKLNPFGDGLAILRTLISMLRDRRPLTFFGVIGLIFIMISLYPGGLALYEKITYGYIIHLPSTVLAALLFILGIQMIVLGMLADMQIVTRRRSEYLMRKYLEK